MYEPLTPADEEGALAFRQLLKERTGYPERRGALADLERASGIPGPHLGRYIRGEVRPNDATLRQIAPALGMTYVELWAIVHPQPHQERVLPPDPDKVYRLGALLNEAQTILNELRDTRVQSTIANERRKRRVKKIHPAMDESNQPYGYLSNYRIDDPNQSNNSTMQIGRQEVALSA